VTALIEIEHEARQRNEWSSRMHGPTFRLGGLFSPASPISLPTFTLWWRLQEHLMFDAEKIIR